MVRSVSIRTTAGPTWFTAAATKLPPRWAGVAIACATSAEDGVASELAQLEALGKGLRMSSRPKIKVNTRFIMGLNLKKLSFFNVFYSKRANPGSGKGWGVRLASLKRGEREKGIFFGLNFQSLRYLQ
jgi:hypothetical protein